MLKVVAALVLATAVGALETSQTFENDLRLVDDDALCVLTSNDYDATYDLSSLAKSASFFNASDVISYKNYQYVWTLCGKIDMVKFASAYKTNVCEGVAEQGPSSVQFQTGDVDECHVTGVSSEDSMSFMEEDGNIVGVSLKYSGGEVDAEGSPRTFTMNYRCGALAEDVIGEVTEVTTGDYIVEIESVHACPTQCVASYESGELCSSHGHCAVDKTAKKARCYCNTGFSGTYCSDVESAADEDTSATSVLIGLDITLLLVLVCLAGTIIWKMQALKEDSEDQTYAQMDDDGESPSPRMGGGEVDVSNSINNVGPRVHPRSRSNRPPTSTTGDDLSDLYPTSV